MRVHFGILCVLRTYLLDTIQDFVCELGMKPHRYVTITIVFVMVRPMVARVFIQKRFIRGLAVRPLLLCHDSDDFFKAFIV